VTQLLAGQSDTLQVQAGAFTPVSGSNDSWLDVTHPLYDKLLPRWQMVSDFYLGEVADENTARTYLVQRFQGEPLKAFNERVKVADYTPHLGTLIDTLAGMLFAVEDRATRVWTGESGNDGLGDPNKKGTPAHRLMMDADGKGCGWLTLWRRCTLDIINTQFHWVLVDTVKGRHVVKLVPPTAVPNWVEGHNGPIDVLMKERRDSRTRLDGEGIAEQETFIRWQINGWTRWVKDADGTPRQLTGEGSRGSYAYVDRNGDPTLPIFPVQLPIRRYVAWLLAKKAAVIFNQESVRDFAIRVASFVKLVIGTESEEQFGNLLKKIQAGENILPEGKEVGGAHRFISPVTDALANASEVLKTKIEDFWKSGFKMYADSAREKTATEVKQDVAAGVGAFLQLLKAAVDDAENGALWRLEQAERSESPDSWGIARVERSDDFSAIDLSAIIDTMRNRYLGTGTPVPVGRSALIQLSKDSARYDGLPVVDGEIEAAVDAKRMGDLMQSLESLGVAPAEVKARIAMRLVAAMGLIDPKEEVQMADGEKKKLLAVLIEQTLSNAKMKEEADRRMAELPAFDPGAPLPDATAPKVPNADAPGSIATEVDLVLNGAQITAAVAIVTSVTKGDLPRDTGVEMLQAFFNIKPEQAEQVMGSAGTKTPTTPNPNPAADNDDPPPTGPRKPPVQLVE